jgi:hypothetical protein
MMARPATANGARGATPARRRLQRAGRWAAWAFGALVLALAFASYLSPDMAFTLMTQAWSCL